jgi:hypothetical protein
MFMTRSGLYDVSNQFPRLGGAANYAAQALTGLGDAARGKGDIGGTGGPVIDWKGKASDVSQHLQGPLGAKPRFPQLFYDVAAWGRRHTTNDPIANWILHGGKKDYDTTISNWILKGMGSLSDALTNRPFAYSGTASDHDRDTHQDRPAVAHFSFDSSSTKSFSTELQAPRTTGQRQVRSSMVQKSPRALHHPRAIDLPGR